MTEPARRRRRRASDGDERQARGSGGISQLPWRPLDNPHPPMEPLSADQVEAIQRPRRALR